MSRKSMLVVLALIVVAVLAWWVLKPDPPAPAVKAPAPEVPAEPRVEELTIRLDPLPGSEARATLKLSDGDAVATATGIADAEGVVMIHVLSEPDCEWEGRLALVFEVWEPEERGEGARLSDGVPREADLVVYEDVPPGNTEEDRFRGSLSQIKSAVMFEVFYDDRDQKVEAETRFLACGNVDGAEVGGWENRLDENLRIRGSEDS